MISVKAIVVMIAMKVTIAMTVTKTMIDVIITMVVMEVMRAMIVMGSVYGNHDIGACSIRKALFFLLPLEELSHESSVAVDGSNDTSTCSEGKIFLFSSSSEVQ